MNNLGTVEQGAKVYKNIIHKLDKNEKLTGFVMKEPEFYNLTKFLRNKTDNRIFSKTLKERVIYLTIRNVFPANATKDLREVTIKMKPRNI